MNGDRRVEAGRMSESSFRLTQGQLDHITARRRRDQRRRDIYNTLVALVIFGLGLTIGLML